MGLLKLIKSVGKEWKERDLALRQSEDQEANARDELAYMEENSLYGEDYPSLEKYSKDRNIN